MHRSLVGQGVILTPLVQNWTNSVRTITDIPWYMLTDASHLHLVNSRSSKRKFDLKLEKLEKDRQAAERRKQSPSKMLNPSELKPIELPNFIERGPTDVLRFVLKTRLRFCVSSVIFIELISFFQSCHNEFKERLLRAKL